MLPGEWSAQPGRKCRRTHKGAVRAARGGPGRAGAHSRASHRDLWKLDLRATEQWEPAADEAGPASWASSPSLAVFSHSTGARRLSAISGKALPEGSTLQPRPPPETAISAGGAFDRGSRAQGLHRNLSIRYLLAGAAGVLD